MPEVTPCSFASRQHAFFFLSFSYKGSLAKHFGEFLAVRPPDDKIR